MAFLRDLFGKRQPADASSAVPDEDAGLLQAEPISRKRMDLLWLDPPHLAQLETPLAQYGVITVSMGDGSAMRDHEITMEDFRWAKGIERVVDKAFGDVQGRRFADAIRHYTEALALAPGCDLFLMSIGSAYGQLGELQRAVRFLERAAEISPGNLRIRQNLAAARRL